MDFIFGKFKPHYFKGSYYNIEQIAALAFFTALTFVFYYIYKNKPAVAKWRFVYSLTAIAVAFRVFIFFYYGFIDRATFSLLKLNPARWLAVVLPTSVCAFNTYIFPVALKTKNTLLLQYTTTISMLGGALGAFSTFGVPLTRFLFFEFYLSHWIYIAMPLYLLVFRMFKPLKRAAPRLMLIWVVLLSMVYSISTLVNYTINTQFNPDFAKTLAGNKFVVSENEYIYTLLWTVYPEDIVFFQFLFRNFPRPYLYLFLVTPIMISAWVAEFAFIGLAYKLKQKRAQLKAVRGKSAFPARAHAFESAAENPANDKEKTE